MVQSAIGRPMEILLVEDSLVAAKFAIKALERSGIRHRLSWLNHGEDASEFVLQEHRFVMAPRPDLVLLDLNLPGCSGREILRRIRTTDHLKQIAVVIMTAEEAEQGIETLDGFDVQGYLVKPIDVKDFVSLIERLKAYWKAAMIVPEAFSN